MYLVYGVAVILVLLVLLRQPATWRTFGWVLVALACGAVTYLVVSQLLN